MDTDTNVVFIYFRILFVFQYLIVITKKVNFQELYSYHRFYQTEVEILKYLKQYSGTQF